MSRDELYGEELYKVYQSNLRKLKMMVKSWEDISHAERAAWNSTARYANSQQLIEEAIEE